MLRCSCSGVFWLLVAANGASLNTTDVYENLYANHGYHADLRLSHASSILHLLQSVAGAFDRPVLDVGCSHGLAVEKLWKMDISAIGVDIAPTAVQKARTHREFRHSLCGEFPCFQVGTATTLPFPDKSLDAIFSTDVLEHLLPEEAPAMVTEFLRVTRKMLFLKIATTEEINKQPINALKMSNRTRYQELQALHTTVWPISKWASLFATKHRRLSVFSSGDTLAIWI